MAMENALGRMLGRELDAVEYPFGRRPPYQCPACGSDNIAKDVTTTTYYQHRPYVRATETVVRCVDCGEGL